LQLTVEEERFELYETITASGSRYEAVDDARTYVWFKGQRANLTVRGVTYPECVVAN
jgi:membrane-bound inhibitor of C-type lysozyme